MATINYKISAVSVNIWFNKYGDHDHNGLMYIHEKHKPILEYIKLLQNLPEKVEFTPALNTKRNELITEFGLTGNTIRINEWLPDSKTKAKQPHPLISPLVLRAAKGDTVKVKLTNEIKNRKVGLHLVGPGANATNDGTHVGTNASSLIDPNPTDNSINNKSRTYTWKCDFEDVYVFHDGGDFRGSQSGTNAHGLFGALVGYLQVRGGQTPKLEIPY